MVSELTIPGLDLNAKIEELEAMLLPVPGMDPSETMPVRHLFADGIYIRAIFMRAIPPIGSIVIGHEHRTRHFNVILNGLATVRNGDRVQEVKAGDIFMSEAGVRKVLHVKQDMIWLTIHPNPDNCRDIAVLEDRLRVKSGACLDFERSKELSGKPEEIHE